MSPASDAVMSGYRRDKQTYAAALDAAMSERRMSGAALAALLTERGLPVTKQAVHTWRTAKHLPALTHRREIRRVLHVPIDPKASSPPP